MYPPGWRGREIILPKLNHASSLTRKLSRIGQTRPVFAA